MTAECMVLLLSRRPSPKEIEALKLELVKLLFACCVLKYLARVKCRLFPQGLIQRRPNKLLNHSSFHACSLLNVILGHAVPPDLTDKADHYFHWYLFKCHTELKIFSFSPPQNNPLMMQGDNSEPHPLTLSRWVVLLSNAHHKTGYLVYQLSL